MADEVHKMSDDAPKPSASLSLWFVKAGNKVAAVKLRTDRSVKDAVVATAQALKKRYQQRSPSEARAGRVGR